MTDLTRDEIAALIEPFEGDHLRLGPELGHDALRLRPAPHHRRIVDDEGDDVAFVGHPIDGRLMAAAPQLARQLLALMDERACPNCNGKGWVEAHACGDSADCEAAGCPVQEQCRQCHPPAPAETPEDPF